MDNKQYGTKEFTTVERIYSDTRDMAVNLLDMSNMANRLKDYIGKENINKEKSPWNSTFCYLFIVIIVISVIAYIFTVLTFAKVIITIILGIIVVLFIAGLQLKNDNKISDKTFFLFIKECLNSLASILHIIRK